MRSNGFLHVKQSSYDMKEIGSDDESSFLDSTSDEDTVDDDFIVMMNNTEKRKKNNNKANQGSTTAMTEEMKQQNAQAVAAGVTTGAVGMVFGGPITAAIVGFGTMFVAKNDTATPVGDAARSVGSVALQVTDIVKDIDDKHQISSKTSEHVKHMDEKLRVSEKSTALLTKTIETLECVNEKAQLDQKVNDVVNTIGTLAYTTQNRMILFNEKHGWTDKVKRVWHDFERNVLLTEDDLEFQKQIQYLCMERELEKESMDDEAYLLLSSGKNHVTVEVN